MRNHNHNEQTVIEVRGLTKRFGTFTAVDNITFSVPRGQIFGFLGPNGSGKTTTIRMLLALLNPTSGTTLVLGHDIRRQALGIRAQMGYMSQKFTLYNDLTVAENLRFYGRSYGLHGKRLKTRMEYVLDMAHLTGREQETPPKLSGGWRQRLALGTAIIHEPDIVFLDEPTAGVDPLSRRAFWDLLYSIAAQGTTIFVTTHYMDEAEHCERLGFIYYGQLIAEGTPSEIKQAHVPGDVVQLTPADATTALHVLKQAHDKQELDGSVDISLYGAQIHVVTRKPQHTRMRIEQVLQQADQSYTDLDIIPPLLEDAFIRLVQAQKQGS